MMLVNYWMINDSLKRPFYDGCMISQDGGSIVKKCCISINTGDGSNVIQLTP